MYILLPLEHRPSTLTNAEHFMCDQNVNFNLEKPASAHVRMGSRLRSRISLARGRRLLQSHNKTHNVCLEFYT